MRLVKPSFEIIDEEEINEKRILKKLERAGRVCYKSEDRITEDSCVKFCKVIQSKNHLSVLEHQVVSVLFTIDRGVSHELVRHRIASYSQESTRYCNYGNQEHVTFVIPPWLDIQPGIHPDMYGINYNWPAEDKIWLISMSIAEQNYKALLKLGWTPQQARSVLPNSLKTEIFTTFNLREWMHVFDLRTAKAAHPQMREIMCPLLIKFRQLLPTLFENIGVTS